MSTHLPTRATGRRLPAAAVGVVLAALLLPAAPVVAAADHPDTGSFFEYTFHRAVGGGSGEYYGYTDDTRSSGRYDIIAVNATQATVHARYDWTYSTSEGGGRSGHVDRQVTFSLPDRHYSGQLTDYDELDGTVASAYAVWFWVPPGSARGTQVLVLDNLLTVRSRDATVWVNGLPRTAVELSGTGTGSRNDAYGQFSFTYTDTYWFDLETGMFLRERYEEKDTGTWFGDPAGFTWTEDLEFTGGSYEPPLDTAAFAVFLFEIAAVLAFVGYVAWRFKWRARTVYPTDGGAVWSVKVRLLKDPSKLKQVGGEPHRSTKELSMLVDPEAKGVTENFQPFLWDFARKGKLAGDRMAVAENRSGLQGLAIYNRESRIGTVFAQSTEIAESLRRMVGAQDFFSEWRHQVPTASRSTALSAGVVMNRGDAYNVFDTYNVMRLDTIPESGYDTSLVQRMRPEDVGDVARLAKFVYKIDSKKFVESQLAAGDFGYVARVDGRLVGFGFATYTGAVGRVHTLAVDPGFRNRGIGREILRARLAALRDLGAKYVLSEIAEWNLGSMELAVSHGFRPVGKMYVETARSQRVKRDIMRR